MPDTPIDPVSYLHGPTVVDIGEYRVSRGMTRRPSSGCSHHRLHYDPKERRIWCPDCESDVEPFDAFQALVERYDRARKKLAQDKEDLEAARAKSLHHIAARVLDRAWRSRLHVPACPCCGNGLFAADFRTEPGLVGKEYARAMRKRREPSD